ncbi:MAG: PAS domain-containing protein [Gemmatimonadaceae bacterium]|nr:PAS domain-containing protein [Gemmatimonadaceae bacterium]
MRPDVAYLLLIVATLALLGAVCATAWRRRRAPGGRRFVAFVAAAWLWVLLVAAMALADPPTARVLLAVKYLVIGTTFTTSFLFIAERTGHLARLGPARLAALFAIPLLGHLASLSDHGGMVGGIVFARQYGLTYIAEITFGPVYWVFTLYGYSLAFAALAFLALARRSAHALAREQAPPLFVGVLAPLVANVALLTGLAPRAFDPMPVGLAVSAACLWWGTHRRRMLDLIPVARSVLVDALDDGVAIVDDTGRVLDINPRFAAVLGIAPAAAIGLPLAERAPAGTPLGDALRGALDAAAPRAISHGAQVFDVRAIAVDAARGPASARIVVLHDVTERQRWQDEQQRLIGELQEALAQVRTLSGLLPICASCKRIRDDDGAWQTVERYIQTHTDAEFSHGVCPTCMDTLYPELDLAPATPPRTPR